MQHHCCFSYSATDTKRVFCSQLMCQHIKIICALRRACFKYNQGSGLQSDKDVAACRQPTQGVFHPVLNLTLKKKHTSVGATSTVLHSSHKQEREEDHEYTMQSWKTSHSHQKSCFTLFILQHLRCDLSGKSSVIISFLKGSGLFCVLSQLSS